MKLGFCTALIK